MGIASNIKLRRLELGITQQELAESVGYRSRTAVAKIESGINEVPLSKLIPLSRALDTTVEALLEGMEDSFVAETRGARPRRKVRKPEPRVAAIVLAGGRSARGLHRVPNQFISVLGKPLIGYCMEAYQGHSAIADIVVVCSGEYRDVVSSCARRCGISKFAGCASAGGSGVESARQGVRMAREMGYEGSDVVVFQESTRPFVTESLVTRLLDMAREKGSAITGEPMSDRVQFARAEDGSVAYLDRNRVMDLQSPDAHRISLVEEAFARAEREGRGLAESNCGMLFHALGMPLHFCEGIRGNLKVVRQEDVAVAAALIAARAAC